MNSRQTEYFSRIFNLGFTFPEAVSLRRIEMTLKRWAERECGDGSSWAIERDETTGRPFNVYHGEGKPRRYPIPDRETGALKRLEKIVAERNARVPDDALVGYHQGDCRGCMVYLVRKADIRGGESIHAIYNRGFAVCY